MEVPTQVPVAAAAAAVAAKAAHTSWPTHRAQD